MEALMRILREIVIACFGAGFAASAAVQPRESIRCDCDHTSPGMLESRQCSLCREAERQPRDIGYFFVKDNNPRKPNRWLILPRQHESGLDSLSSMPPELSAKFWSAALEKGRSLWGNEWGLAVNGERSRTQCHAHVHIGRFLEAAEDPDFLLKSGGATGRAGPPVVLKDPGEIRIPENGRGFWLHAAGQEIHMHIDDSAVAAEFVLVR
jgi:diadenosine tetraphosphate (Ap4A) HIT family hydrolase